MKGGSGAGIMLNENDVLYCFGFMKETLKGGMLNDIYTVRVDDIIPILSKQASRTFTPEEIETLKNAKQKEELNISSNQLSDSNNVDGQLALLSQLLENTIPALIDTLQDEQALALLQSIEEHCELLVHKHPKLNARYHYCRGQYARLMSDTDSSKTHFHLAYLLDKENELYIAKEVRSLYKEGEKDAALKLMNSLPENHPQRIAIQTFEAENQEEYFSHLPKELQDSYAFRYLILDLTNKDFGFPEAPCQNEGASLLGASNGSGVFSVLHFYRS